MKVEHIFITANKTAIVVSVVSREAFKSMGRCFTMESKYYGKKCHCSATPIIPPWSQVYQLHLLEAILCDMQEVLNSILS